MWIAGIMIVLMGFSTTLDVIMRTLFNKPVLWAFDLVCYLSAAAAFLAGGYGQLTNRHVKVDVFYDRLSVRTRAILDVLTSFLFFLFCYVLVNMGLDTTLESLQSGATAGNVLNPPLFIPQMLVPLGGLLLGLQGFFLLIKNIKVALGHQVKEGGGN